MPTADNRPLKVFLCHARADRDRVHALYTRLTKDGVDAWLDKEKLLPGQDWELEIRKAVREADVVVVCLSKQFNQAGFRQKEVRLALDTAMEKPEGEIFIIPARLEECENLESLKRWHWVDLFEDNGYEMLMRALRRRADNIGATLQEKRNWLSKITISRSQIYELAVTPKSELADESNISDNSHPPDNFPEGWDKKQQHSVESEHAPDNFPDDWEKENQPNLDPNKPKAKTIEKKQGSEKNIESKPDNSLRNSGSSQKRKVCPTCGTRVSLNATRCLVCGTEFSSANKLPDKNNKTSSSKSNICPTCGTRLNMNVARCLVCGTDFFPVEKTQPRKLKSFRYLWLLIGLVNIVFYLLTVVGYLSFEVTLTWFLGIIGIMTPFIVAKYPEHKPAASVGKIIFAANILLFLYLLYINLFRI